MEQNNKMSNIKEILLYTISTFNEKEIPIGRNLLPEILYFSLDEAEVKENFKPTSFGIYSPLIQDTIDNLIYSNQLNVVYSCEGITPIPNIIFSQEFKPTININEDIKIKINNIIDYYKNNNLALKDLLLLSKIDFLTSNNKDVDFKKIKSIAKLYDWKQIMNMNENIFNFNKLNLRYFKSKI